MKPISENVRKSLAQLLRFVFWYVIIVAAAFYLLPLAGSIIQQHYESMSSAARFFTIVGFFGVIAAWHLSARSARPDRYPDR